MVSYHGEPAIQGTSPHVVLGGGGFFGQNLVRFLSNAGLPVTAVGRSKRPSSIPLTVHWIQADLTDRSELPRIVSGADVVYYLLSSLLPGSSVTDAAATLNAECAIALALLELAKAGLVRKIVFASSGGTIYGATGATAASEAIPPAPVSFYGMSKLMIERYSYIYRTQHQVRCCCLRVSNPYGPHQTGTNGQGMIGRFVAQLLRSDAIEIWGDGSVVRDFIFIEDVSRAFLSAASYDGSCHVINIGSGVGRSVRSVIEDLTKLLGVKDPGVVYSHGRGTDVPYNVLDISLARKELGWDPMISWEEGLVRTVGWQRENLKV